MYVCIHVSMTVQFNEIPLANLHSMKFIVYKSLLIIINLYIKTLRWTPFLLHCPICRVSAGRRKIRTLRKARK